ncbi:MAG: DUF4125 family protein [Anaerovoracaceae bacterium]
MNDSVYETMKPEKRNLIIEQIIRSEWEMLQSVQELGERPCCKDGWGTFHIMRYSNFHPWTDRMLRSYLRDLNEAFKARRNLVMEKYAYMMEYTDYEYYRRNLEPHLPPMEEEKRGLISEISQYILDCEREFVRQYPRIGSMTNAIEAKNDTKTTTSIESYLKGELRTYSTLTLRHFVDFVRECRVKGINYSFLVREKTVQMYGYESLDDAEVKI